MKKFIVTACIILSATCAFSQETALESVTHSPEYYRQQVIVVQKYSKNNFMRAIYEGNTKLIEAYIKSGMSPDAETLGFPAVMYAIGANRPESLEVLIKNGANIENSRWGISPLLFAINKKNTACAELLIKNNANVNFSNQNLSPLYVAVNKKQYNTVESLLNSGAIINDKILIKAIKSKNSDMKNLILKTAVNQLNN